MINTKISSVISLLILLLGFAGCNRQESAVVPPQAGELRVFSTVTAADHIIAELGCKEKIVAIDRHGKVLESMQGVTVASAGSTVSREFLSKHRINCAIIWHYQKELYEFLRKEKIYTIVVMPITLENYSDLVLELGKLCCRTSEAERLKRNFLNVLADSAVAGKVKRVYFELYAPWKVPAAGGCIGSIMQKAGGVFAVAAANGGTVSAESVCMAQPEVIFYVENFADASEIAARSALCNTPAVKCNRIYAVPRHLVSEGVAPEKLLKFLREKLKDN